MSANKFDMTDIDGASPNPHGKAKFLQGRNSLALADIEASHPRILK